jgi:hypothetical protein
MNRFFVLATASASVLSLVSAAFGQQSTNDALRTADQAQAMLTKAVAAVKADKAKALDMFNKGEGGFRNGKLYVSCFNVSDNKLVATGAPYLKNMLGTDGRTFKDLRGGTLKLEAIAQKPEGEVTRIDVQFAKTSGPSNARPKRNLRN